MSSSPETKNISYNPAKARPALVTAEEWSEIEQVVLAAAQPLAHLSQSSLNPFLRALILVASYVRGLHQELSVEWILNADVLEAFAKSRRPATSVLARLNRLAKLHGLEGASSLPAGVGRVEYHAPYSRDEIEALLRAAGALSTENRRLTATAVIALGAGCGVVRAEATEVTAGDIHEHSNGPYVKVSGHCAKIRGGFEATLNRLVQDRPVGYLRGTMSADHVIENVRTWLGGMPGVPILAIDRLRATYICELLRDGVSVLDLMAWTGLRGPESLSGYLNHVPVRYGCEIPSEGIK